MGRSKLNSAGSMVGRFYGAIEGPMDKFLSEATPSVARVWQATNAWTGKSNPWDNSKQSRKDFEALSAALGKYMPFESAGEMAERAGLGAGAPTLAGITGGINKFSAMVLLRVMEVAHPIMNLTGIVNAAPSVIRNFQPQAGESMKDFAARIGHSRKHLRDGQGSAIGVPDMTKLAGRAFKKAWSREAHPEYDYMVRRGFLSQEVAEFHRQFGAIDTPGKWQTFLRGRSDRPDDQASQDS